VNAADVMDGKARSIFMRFFMSGDRLVTAKGLPALTSWFPYPCPLIRDDLSSFADEP
jgi:hypothetical protein